MAEFTACPPISGIQQMNLDAAISELSRTIQEREQWMAQTAYNGDREGYEYRIQCMRKALELLQGLRVDA